MKFLSDILLCVLGGWRLCGHFLRLYGYDFEGEISRVSVWCGYLTTELKRWKSAIWQQCREEMVDGVVDNSPSLIWLQFIQFFNTIFVSSHIVPREPEETRVIIGSMNMRYDIYPTLPRLELNLFRPKREPILLGHSDGWSKNFAIVPTHQYQTRTTSKTLNFSNHIWEFKLLIKFEILYFILYATNGLTQLIEYLFVKETLHNGQAAVLFVSTNFKIQNLKIDYRIW